MCSHISSDITLISFQKFYRFFVFVISCFCVFVAGGGRSAIRHRNEDLVTAGGGGGGSDCERNVGCGGGGGEQLHCTF